MTEVTIIEDDKEICELLCDHFQEKQFKTKYYVDGSEFLSDIDKISSTVFIVDWILPGESGIKLVKEIRKKYNDAIIIMISGNSTEDEILCGLNAGSDDFMPKPLNLNELVAKTSFLLQKKEIIDKQRQEIASKSSSTHRIQLNNESSIVIKDNKSVKLSKSEFLIFKALYESQGKAITRESLASIIGQDKEISSRNVDVHIFNIRKKMESLNISIKSIRGTGYIIGLN